MTLETKQGKGLFFLGASIMMVIVFAMVFWDTLNITKISGSYYQRITQRKDLIADILPPPQFIIEPYLIMYQMLDETDKAKLEQLAAKARELRVQYEARHEFWAGMLPEGKTREELIVASYRPAVEFFEIIDKQVMPAILRGDKENAHTLIRDLLTPKYEDHRLAIENVVKTAAEAIRREERESAVIVERRLILLVLLGLGIIGLVLLHRRAEQALHQTEENFRRSLEESPLGVRIVTEKGETLYANRAILSIYGYDSIEDLKTTPAKKRYTPESYAEFQIRREKRRQGVCDPSEYEISIVRKDGEVRHLQVVRKEILWDGERQFQVIYQDITERKWAEQALQESQQMLQSVLDTIPVRVFWKDRNSSYLGCNRPFALDAGLQSPEELIGRNDFEMGWAEQAHSYLSDDRLVMETGEPKLGYEETQTTPAGGRIWLRTNKVPLRDAEGKVNGVLGTYEDITKSKQMEEMLRASETKYRIVADNTYDWEYWTSPKGRFLYTSPSCLRVTGYAANEFEADPKLLSRIVHPDDLSLFQAHVKQTKNIDTANQLEFRIVRRDGAIRWIGHLCQPVFDDQGRFAGRRGSNRDITARNQAEQALQDSSEKLKFFAYSVAHDLKSPAVGVYGLTKLLSKHARNVLDEKGRSYCDQILKVSEHIAALVEKINIYIATKEAAPLIETTSITEILRMLRDEFSSQLSLRRIDWLMPESEVGIKADRLSILRIFRNLIDNALKYGGESLTRISIGYEDSESFHIFSVSDNGKGLKEADSEKIFGLFQRNETSRGVEGAGLGLAIVKEIAEQHGGRVWVEPRGKKGITFYVSISKTLSGRND
jgi:PAS domain S-box-containing protein